MPHLVYLTAGAAGMFCGSCMHDNALARAISKHESWDVTLVPTYTPIRTDESNHSIDQVFFGGINVYLQQKIPLFRHLPGFFDRWLDNPRLIRRVTAKASDTSPKLLGQLAVSMLQGSHGFQRKEVARLLDWLRNDVQPDVVLLTNVLIGGCVEDIQQQLQVPVIATLQGDDIFLDSLPEPYRQQAIDLASHVANRCDGLISHSQFYADFMSQFLKIEHPIQISPLGIEVGDLLDIPRTEHASDEPVTIGYLARIAPEKGLHILVEAFLTLKQRPGTGHVRLAVAGWLGDHRREWFQQQWGKLKAAGLSDCISFTETIDKAGKRDFLAGIDLLCVPTEYREPKGLFALEAMASGIPVVVPQHGAFPEMIAASQGGLLCPPNDAEATAECLYQMVQDPKGRQALGQAGREHVKQHRNEQVMAEQTIQLLEAWIERTHDSADA